MKLSKKMLLGTTLPLIYFTGCVSNMTTVEKDFQNQIKLSVDNKVTNVDLYKKFEEKGDNSYIDLSNVKTLKEALSQLSEITKKIYILKGENISLLSQSNYNSKLLHIDTLDKLKKYINETSNFELEWVNKPQPKKIISTTYELRKVIKKDINNNLKHKELLLKNKKLALKDIKKSKFFTKNVKEFMKPKKLLKKPKKIVKYEKVKVNKIKYVMPKDIFSNNLVILKVKPKTKLYNSFNNIKFEVAGRNNIGLLLKQLMEITNYNVIYKEGINSSNSDSGIVSNSSETDFDKFKKQIIYYKGTNVLDFLNYISNMYNLYLDIDTDNHLIVFSKYKTKVFNLITPNVSISLNDSNTGSSNDNVIATNPVSKQIKYEITTKFIDGVKDLLNNDKNSKILETTNGIITIKTTKNNMKVIEKMFNKFNNLYSKQLQVRLETYMFLLNKDYNLGIDFSYKNGKESLVTNYISSYIFKTNINKNVGLNLNTNTNIIRFDKKYRYTFNLTNNIPSFVNLQDKTNYLKSLTTTTTNNTSTTTETSTDIGTVSQGQILTLLARINGNNIYVKTNLKINTLNSMKEVTVNGTTVMLPSLSTKILPSTNILHFGDKKIIGVYETYESINNYNGILPIEKFAIGGNNKENYVRKLIVLVLTVKKL